MQRRNLRHTSVPKLFKAYQPPFCNSIPTTLFSVPSMATWRASRQPLKVGSWWFVKPSRRSSIRSWRPNSWLRLWRLGNNRRCSGVTSINNSRIFYDSVVGSMWVRLLLLVGSPTYPQLLPPLVCAIFQRDFWITTVCIFSIFYRGWIKRGCTTVFVNLIQPRLIIFFLLVNGY